MLAVSKITRRLSPQFTQRLRLARSKHSWHYRDGSVVLFNFSSISKAKLRISSAWTEYCQIDGETAHRVHLTHGTNFASLSPNEDHTDPIDLVVTIPERCNIIIKAKDIDLEFNKKILGDLNVECDSGRIKIDKHRGEHICILSSSADISVFSALEGNINLSGRNIELQLIHSNNAVIRGNEFVKINAAYSKSLKIQSKGSVEVGMMQGNCEIQSINSISIPKLIGSIDANSTDGDVTVYIDELSADKASSVVGSRGAVAVSLNPKIQASLLCEASGGSRVVETSNLSNFDADRGNGSDDTITGMLGGESGNGNVYRNTFTSGKINVKNDPKGKGYADAKAFFDKLNPSVNLIEADTTRHADRAHAVSGAFSSGTTLGGSLSVKGSTVFMSSKSWIDQLKEKHGVKLS